VSPRTAWRKAGGPRRPLMSPRVRPCSTAGCGLPATWEIVSQSPRMAAPGFYPVCTGCHDRIVIAEMARPPFNPPRHVRLPS